MLLAVTAVALIGAATARANGDPASDVLYTNWVFIPSTAPVPTSDVTRLNAVVANARADGYPIKVAIIAQPADLGTAFALWRKPQQYARFLGLELRFLYKGPLLIVMPDGYGLFHFRTATPERRALRGLSVSPGPTGLARSAVTAVAALARDSGHPIAVPPVKDESSGISDRFLIIVAAIVLGLAFTGLELWRRKRRA